MSKFAFQPGDVIETVEPLSRILTHVSKRHFCQNCFKYGQNLKRCTKCLITYYCNKTCQLKDWKNCHKLECSSKVLERLAEMSEDDQLNLALLFRTWAILQLGPSLSDRKFPVHFNDSDISFNDIKEKYKSQMNHPIFKSFANGMAMIMNSDAKVILGLDMTKLLEILVVQNVTLCKIFDSNGMRVIGLGLYPQIGSYRHACKPNTNLVCITDWKCEFRAIAPIKIGEFPTMSLLMDILAPREDRIKLLSLNLMSSCNCELCELERNESVIDYKELKTLLMKFSQNHDKMDMTFADVVEKHKKIVDLYRKIYHLHDKRISSQYLLLLHTVIKYMEREEEMDTRTQLVEEIKEHVGITFGINFQDKFFRKMCKVMLGKFTSAEVTYVPETGEHIRILKVDDDVKEEEVTQNLSLNLEAVTIE